jgi:hypothetical protein
MMNCIGFHFLICEIRVTILIFWDYVKIKLENKCKALKWDQEFISKTVILLTKNTISKVFKVIRTVLFATSSVPHAHYPFQLTWPRHISKAALSWVHF